MGPPLSCVGGELGQFLEYCDWGWGWVRDFGGGDTTETKRELTGRDVRRYIWRQCLGCGSGLHPCLRLVALVWVGRLIPVEWVWVTSDCAVEIGTRRPGADDPFACNPRAR